jgi:hypothetical protein
VREIRKARKALIAQGGDVAAGPDESMLSRISEMFTANRGLLDSRLKVLKAVPILAHSLNISVKEGYGRLDAFGIGRDEFFGTLPGNMLPADAPVSLPHIWGLMYTGWLQWGANTNSVMERNIGQALGVGALFDKNFNSTIRIENLHRMEGLAYKLQPPVWPDFFPAIDQAKAARGEKRFTEFCAPCHEKWEQDGLMRSYKLHAAGGGRDGPADGDRVRAAGHAARRHREAVRASRDRSDHQGQGEGLRGNEARCDGDRRARSASDPQGTAVGSGVPRDAARFGEVARQQGRKVYRSKTLVGIWATPPFLHNGSVPTLYHLLKPAAERPVTFYTGQRDYDPMKLGLELDRTKFNLPPGLDLFTFDTRIAGNWNTGHEWSFYPQLTEDIRYEIIEYIKTHTKPFDAPPKATREALIACRT